MDINNLIEEEFSKEDQEFFKDLNPLKFEDIQKGFIEKEHPLDKIKIRYSKEDDFKTQWEWLIYNSRPSTIFYDMWKDEKDNFVIPRYYTRDWADKYIAYCSGFEDESLWIFDGADIFKNFRPSITQFFNFNKLDKPLKIFSFSYPKGVWAEKYKDKLLLSHNEVITFYELNRDNSVDILFKFGQDFKNYLSEHFRKNNISKSISNLENAIYKSDVNTIQSFFNKEVAHYKNMEFVLDKLGIEIQNNIQLSANFVDISSKYMVKAWWTDENDNPITEALIGDNVKFHLETQNIPNGEIVYMTLFDDDRRVKPLEEDQDNDKIELQQNGKEVIFTKVYKNKVERKIHLINVDNFIKNDEDGVLELFFACSYKKEHKDMPLSIKNYLKVKGMPKIILVNGHWKTANRAPFGENFGPTEPLKPYWSNKMAENANNYYENYSNKKKYELNKKELTIQELEQKNYILYYDGSSDHALDQSGQDRFNNGRKFAQDNYKDIISGLGKEAIYLVSHSEGGAYAAGIADYLHEKGHTMGEHVLLSPDEGDEFEINPLIPSYQILYMFFSSIYNPILVPIKASKFRIWDDYYAIVDYIVNEHKIKGVTKMGIVHRQDAGWTGVHGWTNGSQVFKEVSDLKEVQSFLVQGEHEGEFYSGFSQSETTNKTKFYRINEEYIVTNCPPLIEVQ